MFILEDMTTFSSPAEAGEHNGVYCVYVLCVCAVCLCVLCMCTCCVFLCVLCVCVRMCACCVFMCVCVCCVCCVCVHVCVRARTRMWVCVDYVIVAGGILNDNTYVSDDIELLNDLTG